MLFYIMSILVIAESPFLKTRSLCFNAVSPRYVKVSNSCLKQGGTLYTCPLWQSCRSLGISLAGLRVVEIDKNSPGLTRSHRLITFYNAGVLTTEDMQIRISSYFCKKMSFKYNLCYIFYQFFIYSPVKNEVILFKQIFPKHYRYDKFQYIKKKKNK